MITWLGQEAQSPEGAAGQAAYDQAKRSAWPPTEGDFEAIGSAAGTAVGAYFGGPLGAAVGSAVGAAVGSAVFVLGDAIAGGLDPNAGNVALFAWRDYVIKVADSPKNVASELAKQCGTTQAAELAALERWGVALEENGTPLGWGSWTRIRPDTNDLANAKRNVTAFQKQLFAAAAARSAECAALKAQASSAPKKSSAVPLLVGAAAAAGLVAWFLLA